MTVLHEDAGSCEGSGREARRLYSNTEVPMTEPINLGETMGRVLDESYAWLTAGDTELPSPTHTIVTWIQPGVRKHHPPP
jgi:hypothetical protein